jgi:hypothetical protein
MNNSDQAKFDKSFYGNSFIVRPVHGIQEDEMYFQFLGLAPLDLTSKSNNPHGNSPGWADPHKTGSPGEIGSIKISKYLISP